MNMDIVNGIIIFALYLLAMFSIVHIKKDTSIGNFTWGGGCLLLTLYTFFVFSSYYTRQIVVTLFITIWCTRLAYYVWLRYKKGADPRYVAWLEQWKNPLVAFLFSLGWVVGLNGFFSLVMAASSVVINTTSHQPNLQLLDYIGIIIWIFGFLFESISDYQLYVFRNNPNSQNKILNTGLWKYSRHPNYFGEITMWWGIYALALSVSYGWLTIVTPMAITITLVFVTGVPWAERAMEKIPGFAEYKRTTNMLIPRHFW
jgi:steroid 5-alpha reductase family enzyme